MRWSIEAEAPSWSSVMKPILPRALCNDESKTKRHPSSVVENSMSHQSFKEETCVGETNRNRSETQTHMPMVTRLVGAQKKSPRKKLTNFELSVVEKSKIYKS